MGKIVYVKWIDVQTDQTGWLDKDALKMWADEGLVVCHSVGYLVCDREDFIIIAMTEFNGDVDGCTKIPKVNIKQMLYLKEVVA